jgi:membrane protease YdiL (CAAX protease family)
MAAAATLIALGGTALTTLGVNDTADAALRALVTLPATAMLLWIALRVTDVQWSSLGLSAPSIRAAAKGAGAALAAVLGAAGAVLGAGLLVGTATLSAPPTETWLLIPIALIAMVLPEETVFRGYIQHVLGQRWRGLTVVMAQAVLYSASGAIIQRSLAVLAPAFAFAFLLGYIRLLSRGLWLVLGARTGLVVVALVTAEAEFSAGWAIVLVGVPALAALAVAQRGNRSPAETTAGHDLAPLPRRRLAQRGVLYDVGSSYLPGQHSRIHWRHDVIEEEMRVIAQDLQCTAVTVFGHDLQRLEEATRLAVRHGLFVWVQPRLVDGSQEEIAERMAHAAVFSETLRAEHPDQIGLNIGCELSIFAKRIVPGRNFGYRTVALGVLFPFMPVFNRRLNRFLGRLVDIARPRFGGPLTYGSGSWENVDWSPFDMVGIDYYFDVTTRGDYRGGLRGLRRWNKPILITEFGCCAYQGARDRGGAGADILDWSDLNDRKVKPGYVRDESAQADVIGELLDVYETEDVEGAFICMFIEGDCRYSPDPERDQDKASFGIVRPPSLESGLSPDDGHWQPKEAFHTLARRYAA